MVLRAPVPADAPAVLRVLVARDVADLCVPDFTLEDLVETWGASDLDLAQDARVIEVDGQIADASVIGSGPWAAMSVRGCCSWMPATRMSAATEDGASARHDRP